MKRKEFGVNPELHRVRTDYQQQTLSEAQCSADPFEQFESWLAAALEKDPWYANAMTLSTVASSGQPDARIVLLRNVSYGGLTFFTNYKSAKGRQIDANPKASLLFFWKELERQVKVLGDIHFLPAEESDSYFRSRPFESQVSAWVSQQSQVIDNRATLEARNTELLQQYATSTVPRPAHWGGYVLIPSAFEFWQGRPNRLHDRLLYSWQPTTGSWQLDRLMP